MSTNESERGMENDIQKEYSNYLYSVENSAKKSQQMWMRLRESDFRDKRSNYVLKQHPFLRGFDACMYMYTDM